VGDGGGAVISLVQILSVNPVVLLVAPAVGSVFGALHNVTEPAFMAENSRRDERVHLFSMSDGLRTLSVMVGSLIAGFLPLWASAQFGISKVDAYRYATFIGIGWWFLSLIPAVMLKQRTPERATSSVVKAAPRLSLGNLWDKLTANIKTPAVIGKLLVVTGLINLGAGFVVPLMNVFFHQGIHAHEHEIGATFAAGSLFLALGALLSPFVVERIGKVPTVALTRMAAIPFVLVIGLAPGMANPSTVVSIAGLAYILRTTLFNMSGPVFSALSMELLHPGERATVTGMESTLGRILAAVAGFVGASLMAWGDFRTPFFLMTFFFLISTILFWLLFRVYEPTQARRPTEDPSIAEPELV